MTIRIKVRWSERLTIAMLICLQAAILVWGTRMPTHVGGKPILRVAAPKTERVSASISPYGPGFEQELLTMFASEQGYHIEITEVDTPRQAWQALNEGRVQLVVGVGGTAPASLESPFVAGPAYATSRPVLIHSSKRYALRDEDELCQNPILTTQQRYLSETLTEEAENANCVAWTSKVNGVRVTPILDTLNEDRARFALVDDWTYSLWQPFFLGVKPTKTMDREITYRWFWSSESEALHTALSSFWKGREEDGQIAALHERYFGFLPEEADYYDIVGLSDSVKKHLPRYSDTILKYSKLNGIDPLLLTAVIYQESRFDADATSKTGVRGLMQITQNTARVLGVDRTNPQQSIKGGAKYLKMLWDAFESMELDPWDRWFFTLASYNQGLGHVQDAIALSRTMGGTGRTWHDLKKVLPLLAWEKYYSQTKYGYTRGYEAVHYVENIRYYYYILHGLVGLARPEAEHLGTLLSAIPDTWPVL
ncbi:transglycosylase SLT domain-containing protein [Desulfovibrio mangrovi]|uniref:transglycosylase SLT domain-containing protein n=1 Tax=Desulfovibrio mangrovi TaxID=2976983 RepID=UPI0022475D49|nr:transglycosylase SLT domain-containing protein [Desulfovibrio mangrovi]UZP66274.1 transglycosylase SLT domain-containing protein [Desulfovibrio mangrovi]